MLLRAGAPRAKGIISTLRRPTDNQAVLQLAPDVPTLVRVFAPEQGERIRRLGGHPVVVSEAAAEDFPRWFEATLARARPRGATLPGAGAP